MSLLQIRELDKFYGADPILREVQLEIQAGEKWGLVGKNGCGKTTLMRIITGEEDYDRGSVHWAHNARVSYLRQEADFDPNRSIYEELRGLFGALDELQAKIAAVQGQMSGPDLTEETLAQLVEEHHALLEEFEREGGYQTEGRIQGVLRGLDIPEERWGESAAGFSGGERTRLALARILLTSSDILLLDEPTNYLDIRAIEWLEEFLIGFKGAVLLISHDRFFLDRVVQNIFEIEFHKVQRYRGNYTEYRRQKEARFQSQLKAYELQQKEIAKQERWIRESRATEKSKRRAHSLEKRLAQVERIAKPLQDQRAIKVQFQQGESSGKTVLEVEALSKRFGSKLLLDNAGFRLFAGEKVGLIGPNGAGKTTLLKLILGYESPDQGRIRLGYEVHPGYFSQFTEETALTGTPFSQVMDAADLDNTDARTILARFLFQGEDVFKSVSDLSGGERRRLGLIKLMLSKANFLILDEPTNHLDLDSIEVVERALSEYSGTVLVVSHDRYFLNQVVDRFLAIDRGRLESFESYDDYLKHQSEPSGSFPEPAKPKSEAQSRREQTKELQRELKRRQKSLEQLEASIDSIEAKKQRLTLLLCEPEVAGDYQKSLELSDQLAGCEAELVELYANWEQLQQDLERLNAT
jgi:ATP-binding cassette subfamily F protein 3